MVIESQNAINIFQQNIAFTRDEACSSARGQRLCVPFVGAGHIFGDLCANWSKFYCRVHVHVHIVIMQSEQFVLFIEGFKQPPTAQGHLRAFTKHACYLISYKHKTYKRKSERQSFGIALIKNSYKVRRLLVPLTISVWRYNTRLKKL